MKKKVNEEKMYSWRAFLSLRMEEEGWWWWWWENFTD